MPNHQIMSNSFFVLLKILGNLEGEIILLFWIL